MGRRARVAGQLRLIAIAAWRAVGELYNREGLTHAASVAYYRVFVFLRCAVITGIALAHGVGTHGTDAYRAPHQRFLAHLADALSASGAPEVIPRSRR